MNKPKNFAFYAGIFILVLFFTLAYGQDFSPKPIPQGPIQAGQNKISLDIKGMDIVDVLKMLSQRANLNIVIGKNVSGRVTLFLKEVDVNDAFEIILLANELAYEKKGEIINVMTQRDYELIYGERFLDKKQAKVIRLQYAKAVDLSRALNQIKTNLGKVVVDEGSNTIAIIDTQDKIKEMEAFIKDTDLPVQTKVFNLNYAQADKLQAKIQETITKGVGYVRIDERTNKIAITDYPVKLEEIGKVISAFDEKTQQVLIDAQIIEVSPSDKLQMGVNIDYWIKKYFEIKANLPINTANALILGTPSSDSVTGKGDYKAIVDILRTIGDTKILSSPRIIALNNQEAKIMVGKKEAYITSTTSQGGSGNTVTSQSVNFVDTGIKLFVTPTINKDEFITMKIRPEVSSAKMELLQSEDKKTDVPIVSTSEAETTVMVKDGTTIIIGGLRKDKRDKTVKKIPVLGDIPFLGVLFRSTTDETSTSDLIILLTPHIVSGETSISNFTEIPPKEGAVAKMENDNILIEKVIAGGDKEALLNEFMTFDRYKNSVLEKINKISKTRLKKSGDYKGAAQISFVVGPDGQLKGEPRVISAANPLLEQIGIKSIKEAAPFGPFPASLKKEQEIFTVTFSSG